jgi:hypothetical protein
VRAVSSRRCDTRCRDLGSRALLNYVARVIRALEDPGAIDESDPTSMRHAVELALGRCRARFAALAWALAAQSPVEQPELVFPSPSRAPDLLVL